MCDLDDGGHCCPDISRNLVLLLQTLACRLHLLPLLLCAGREPRLDVARLTPMACLGHSLARSPRYAVHCNHISSATVARPQSPYRTCKNPLCSSLGPNSGRARIYGKANTNRSKTRGRIRTPNILCTKQTTHDIPTLLTNGCRAGLSTPPLGKRPWGRVVHAPTGRRDPGNVYFLAMGKGSETSHGPYPRLPAPPGKGAPSSPAPPPPSPR